MKGSFLRSRQGVAKGVIWTSIFNVLSRILGFVREIVIAYFYGATKAYDSFLSAITPLMLMVNFSAGTVSNVFVSVHAHTRETQGNEKAADYKRAMVALIVLISLAMMLFSTLFSFHIVSFFFPGFSVEMKNIVARILKYASPLILMNALYLMYLAFLRVERLFLTAALIPALFFNPVFILVLVLTANPAKSFPLVLARGASYLAIIVLCTLILGKCAVPSFKFKTLRAQIFETFRLMGPFFLIYAIGTLNIAVDRGFASILPTGTISALNYAVRLRDLPTGIITGALGSVMYPTLATAVARENTKSRDTLLKRSFQLISFFYIPAALLYITFGDFVVSLVYERGAFDEVARMVTYQSLAFYAIGMVFRGYRTILNYLFFSYRDAGTVALINVSSVGLNALLNFILVERMRHMGLAFSTSLSTVYAVILLQLVARRRYGVKKMVDSKYMLGISLATSGSVFISLMCRFFIGGMIGRMIGVVLFCVIFLALARLLKVYDFKTLLKIMMKWREER